jgi:hypothetical protein
MGPSCSTGTNVTDVYQQATLLVTLLKNTGTYTSGTGGSMGTLANGASATLTITATVNATGSYANGYYCSQ